MINRKFQKTRTIAALTAFIFLGFTSGWSTAHGQLKLAENGQSKYTIVIAENASPPVRYASEELQRFLGEISGAKLPIKTDVEPPGPFEILVGKSRRHTISDLDIRPLGQESYILRTVGNHLVIVGGEPRGTLYGIYGLLEDHLGCRWFTPEINRIPKRNPLVIDPLDETTVPVLEQREPYVLDARDGDWCARNRMNSTAGRLTEKHGGKVRFGRGMFVHTFNSLVSPDKYFAEHPEYFSEIEGKRVKHEPQLCCTNEDVVQICTEEMRKRTCDDPEAMVFSLSQNDWQRYCECSSCTALAQREESQMGPVLYLVNRVAEVLEKEFPDKFIETLSYQYTRKPPKTTRPRDNVIIRLCTIECCFMHPLANCDSEENRAFMADLEAWSQMGCKLWVWDYVTSFRMYLVPYPNHHVRDDNIRTFVKNNVTGVFEQDCFHTLNGELSLLSGYINAKFLWNPEYEEDKAINEFLVGVYGAAAIPIRQYIDLMREKVEKENIHENIWPTPISAPYLDDNILAQAEEIWDRAEGMVIGQPDVLERVRFARLSVDFAQIDRKRFHIPEGECDLDHSNFRLLPRMNPEHIATREKISRFFATARRAGVTYLSHGVLMLDEYEKMYEGMLETDEIKLIPHDPVSLDEKDLLPGLNYQYYEAEMVKPFDMSNLTEVASGVCSKPDVSYRKRDEQYALVFTGYIKIPQDGIYTFTVYSMDGVRLLVAGETVVSKEMKFNSIKHGGYVALHKGFHPIRVEHYQRGGHSGLGMELEGPNLPEAELHPDLLFREKSVD